MAGRGKKHGSRGKLLVFPVPKHGTVAKRYEAQLNEFVRARAGQYRKGKSFDEFVDEHREELRRYVRDRVPNLRGELGDRELRRWVLNDEYLYEWARAQGVEL